MAQLLQSKYNYYSLNRTDLENKHLQSLRNIKGCSTGQLKQQECTTRAKKRKATSVQAVKVIMRINSMCVLLCNEGLPQAQFSLLFAWSPYSHN